MLNEKDFKDISNFAVDIRIQTMKEFGNLGFGHLGGSMSIVDVLAVLYGKEMKYDPKNPKWEDRDFLILSKGHAGPALYSVLALKGFIPMEDLMTLNKPGTTLPSHCDMIKTKGIDLTTGSLGQGPSLAVGVALGNIAKGKSNYTYLIDGDGEIQEGQVWEAFMLAGHKKLDHLIAFIDSNNRQIDGPVDEVVSLLDICAKFDSFGWYTKKIDGHDYNAIYDAIEDAKINSNGKPSVIILNTIKGKGVSFAEPLAYNHHISVSKEQAEQTIKELMNQYI